MSPHKPVDVGDVMWVFDPTHHDDPLQWRQATVLQIEIPGDGTPLRRQARAHAKVAWKDGSVSGGHYVCTMRYLDSASTPHVQL